MSLTYRVIKFSHTDGFWVTKEFHSDYNRALASYNEAKADFENVDGAVFLAIEHENYAVVMQFGMEGHEIEVSPCFSINVVQSVKQLQTV